MIVVTGAAGFIGSCIVSKLNELGLNDLILVDHFEDLKNPADTTNPKKENLRNKKYKEYYDKTIFLDVLKKRKLAKGIEAVLHMGACSSTTLEDAHYFKENNFEYSKTLAQWALKHNIHFIYASSAATYGDGSQGYKDDELTIRRLRPLNLYGQSKQDFDLWVLDNKHIQKVVGLKFFNVFGPNEYHKKEMRSVVAKAFEGVLKKGEIALFKSYKKEYAHGEQKRDFIYIKDAVDIVLFFLKNSHIHGIFNVGTGKARTWNGLANALFASLGKIPKIEYIDMPDNLKDKYQYFTEADMSQLCSVGYLKPFRSLEDAVWDYVPYLKSHSYL